MPYYEQLAANYTDVTFLEADFFKARKIINHFKVNAIPRTMIFTGSSDTPVDSIIGFSQELLHKVEASIKQHEKPSLYPAEEPTFCTRELPASIDE